MDDVISQFLFVSESVQLVKELRKVSIKAPHVRIGLACCQVNHPDVGPDGFDSVGDIGVFTSENVYLHPHFAKGGGQLPNVDIHTARLPLSRGTQRTGMKSDECCSLHAQLFVTNI